MKWVRGWARMGGLGLVLAGLAGCADAGSQGNSLAFTLEIDGNDEIVAMRADGTEITNLTQNPARDGGPFGGPAWSPDGREIAFVSDRDGQREVYVMQADGSRQRRLTEGGGIAPAWSPDGGRILFVREEMVDDREVPDIFSVGTDGGFPTRLTERGGKAPQWSPDGSLIAFEVCPQTSGCAVYLMLADGGNQIYLSEGRFFDWSPDGEWIALTFWRDGSPDIYKMRPDGTGLMRLTDEGGVSPIWSPDGAHIAFSSTREGAMDVYLMDADGRDESRLTQHPANDTAPRWSPDSESIAFHSERDGNWEVYVVEVNGSGLSRRISRNESNEWLVAWAP